MKATNSIDKIENVINNIITGGLNNTKIAKSFSDEFKSLEKSELVNVDKIIKKILVSRISDFKEKLANDFIVEESADSAGTNESNDDTCKDKDKCFSIMGEVNDYSEVSPSVKKFLEAFLNKTESSDSTEDIEDIEVKENIDTKYFMLPIQEFENFQKLLKAIKTLKLNLNINDLYKVENGVFYFNTPKGKNSFDTKRIN